MQKRNKHKKIMLILSLCMLLLWTALGAGVSLAWFSSASEVNNIFHFADFRAEVEYLTKDGEYATLTESSVLFAKDAQYEPGYTQIAYLKIKNTGTVSFDLKMAVGVTNYTNAINVYGQSFSLHDYLRFGIIYGSSESELKNLTKERDSVNAVSNTPLSNYSSDVKELRAGETLYVAIVIRMPESVGNVANYRGDIVPRVDLGVIITATQKKILCP